MVDDLLVADRFLGDVIFGGHDWSRRYRFPDRFDPKRSKSKEDLLVRFALQGFEFKVEDDQIRLVHARMQVRLIPYSDKRSREGGFLPDETRLETGWKPPAELVANAQFLSGHLDYFKREPIIDSIFIYGEVAAVFRAMKVSGWDLKTLASSLEKGRAL